MKSFKVSRDLDISLTSNKHFSEILRSSNLGPEPEVAKKAKLFYLWHHSQKIRNPKPKFFSLQTRRLAGSLRV